jgi:hypothetical protein
MYIATPIITGRVVIAKIPIILPIFCAISPPSIHTIYITYSFPFWLSFPTGGPDVEDPDVVDSDAVGPGAVGKDGAIGTVGKNPEKVNSFVGLNSGLFPSIG